MAKVFTGTVKSTKMQDTAVITVERSFKHPMYKKTVKRHNSFKAHVPEGMKLNDGDVVDFQEVRPISKDKTFKVIKIHDKK